MNPATPPPGWYPEASGRLRWWDGSQWGPYAPPQGARTSTALATLAHLGCLLGGFVAPLVVYLISDKTDTFTRDQSREALNFQLTFLLAVFGGFGVLGAGLFAVAQFGTGWIVALFAVLLWLGYIGLIVANFVLSIKGAVRAYRGETYRYPVRISFVRAA